MMNLENQKPIINQEETTLDFDTHVLDIKINYN